MLLFLNINTIEIPHNIRIIKRNCSAKVQGNNRIYIQNTLEKIYLMYALGHLLCQKTNGN